MKDKGFEQAIADVDSAVDINRKARPVDRQLDADARTLYVEIHRSQANAQIAAGNFNGAVQSLLAINDKQLNKQFIFQTGDTAADKQRQAALARQVATTYRDMGLDNVKEKRWTGAIDGFTKAISADASMAAQLNMDLALAYAERGRDRAEHGDLTGAVEDILQGLRTDPRNAQVCRLAGLASCELARHYHDRGRTS